MRATDLIALDLLEFGEPKGTISFDGRRLLLYDADSMGMLRRELVDAVGWKATRGLFTRLAYANGYRDAETLKALFHWDAPEEWYKAGPILQGFEGKAAAIRTE